MGWEDLLGNFLRSWKDVDEMERERDGWMDELEGAF